MKIRNVIALFGAVSIVVVFLICAGILIWCKFDKTIVAEIPDTDIFILSFYCVLGCVCLLIGKFK